MGCHYVEVIKRYVVHIVVRVCVYPYRGFIGMKGKTDIKLK